MTYRINGVTLNKQPLTKTYRRRDLGERLDGSQQKGKWQVQLNFELLPVVDAIQVGEWYLSGTPVSVELPYPNGGAFVVVSGVNIIRWNFTPSPTDNSFGSLTLSLANVDFGDTV